MFRKIALPAVFIVLVALACSNEDTSSPTILLNPNFGNADIGGVISTSVDITAPAGFKLLTITTIVDEVRDDLNAQERKQQIPDQTGLTFPYTFEETTRELAAASVIDIEFVVTDQRDQTDIAFFRVGVNPPSILIAPEFNLTPPQSNVGGSSTSTTFFSTTNEQPSWSVTQVNAETNDISGDIDFGYYYSTTDGGTIASIFDYPIVNLDGMDSWTTRNKTVFRKTTLTPAAFDGAGFAEIYNAFENGTVGERAERSTGLSVDDIIAFETDASKEDGSKRGLIRVHEIQEGDESNDFIRITVVFETE